MPIPKNILLVGGATATTAVVVVVGALVYSGKISVSRSDLVPTAPPVDIERPADPVSSSKEQTLAPPARTMTSTAPSTPIETARATSTPAATTAAAIASAPNVIVETVAAPKPAETSSILRPSFDVVRVEPTGETVVAGRATPNARVALLNRGKPVFEVKADANGQFVMLPPPLEPGDHLLTLRARGEKGDIDSEQNVATSVPRGATEKPLVALSAPDQPTRVLSAPPKSDAVATEVTIVSAEAGEDGSFMASGVAPAGRKAQVYLNNSFISPVEAGPDGKWSLRIEKGMTPGHYDIRVDLLDGASDRVAKRVEAPFDFPAPKAISATRALVPPDSATPRVEPVATTTGKPPGAGPTVVPEIQSVTVTRGDSLWRISRRIYGQGIRYTQIYEANAERIRNPNRIWPGQVFVSPAKQP